MKKGIIFIQDCGTFPYDLLVVAGVAYKDVMSYCREKHVQKNVMKWLRSNKDNFNLEQAAAKGRLLYYEGDGAGVVLLHAFRDTWEMWEVLMHELHHYVNFLSRHVGLEVEIEAQASLQEYLFRSIRRKLQGIDKETTMEVVVTKKDTGK